MKCLIDKGTLKSKCSHTYCSDVCRARYGTIFAGIRGRSFDMQDTNNSNLDTIRYMIAGGTIITGIIYWMSLPQQVPVHFNLFFLPDRVGNKIELLMGFILPLSAIVPWPVPKFHNETEETINLVKRKRRYNSLAQLGLAIVSVVIVWMGLLGGR